jgi:hypothetical protein
MDTDDLGSQLRVEYRSSARLSPEPLVMRIMCAWAIWSECRRARQTVVSLAISGRPRAWVSQTVPIERA